MVSHSELGFVGEVGVRGGIGELRGESAVAMRASATAIRVVGDRKSTGKSTPIQLSYLCRF